MLYEIFQDLLLNGLKNFFLSQKSTVFERMLDVMCAHIGCAMELLIVEK